MNNLMNNGPSERSKPFKAPVTKSRLIDYNPGKPDVPVKLSKKSNKKLIK